MRVVVCLLSGEGIVFALRVHVKVRGVSWSIGMDAGECHYILLYMIRSAWVDTLLRQDTLS